MNDIEKKEALLREAIESPKFSHARKGDRLYRNDTLIYHFHDKSPSGVMLECVGPSTMVDQIIREVRNTSALSPTER